MAAKATVSFAPGQTAASIPITVSADSTGMPEHVVVSFHDPAHADMGGFWVSASPSSTLRPERVVGRRCLRRRRVAGAVGLG